MIKKEKQVERLILEWLKSENENATYIAQQICTLFDNNYSDVMDNHLEENASSKESKHKKITCQTSILSVFAKRFAEIFNQMDLELSQNFKWNLKKFCESPDGTIHVFTYEKSRSDDERTVEFIKLSIYEDSLLTLFCDSPTINNEFTKNIFKRLGKQISNKLK